MRLRCARQAGNRPSEGGVFALPVASLDHEYVNGKFGTRLGCHDRVF
jgi:hypothetical protein